MRSSVLSRPQKPEVGPKTKGRAFYNCTSTNMAEAAASPAKKAPKKPAVKPAHPPYAVMIAAAIKALKERGGSSRQAILKYILANYKIADAAKAQVRAKLAIRKMLEAKTIIPVKGSFKLPKTYKHTCICKCPIRNVLMSLVSIYSKIKLNMHTYTHIHKHI